MNLDALLVTAVVEACLFAFGRFRDAALARVKQTTRGADSCTTSPAPLTGAFAESR